MGTDIHAFIEYKRRSDWMCLTEGQFNLPRDYETFGRLAGVRAPDLKMFAPRGLPADINSYEDYTRLMDHTTSWLTLEEWEAATLHAAPEYHAVTAAMRSLAKHGCEVRIIFGFDS